MIALVSETASTRISRTEHGGGYRDGWTVKKPNSATPDLLDIRIMHVSHLIKTRANPNFSCNNWIIHPTRLNTKLDDSSNPDNMKVSGGPTQDEVMAISLFKLALKEGDIIADVGCGTGKVSIEASRTCERVYAIDVRDEAIVAATHNVAESCADNVKVVKGNAKEVLPGLGGLNGAFIGGSQDLEEVIRILSEQVKGRIVVNAVLLRTLHRAVSTMQDLGIFEEVIQVSVSRSYPLADSFLFRPIDPVYIIIGRCK